MAKAEFDIGIVGDGQLGMMLTEAATELGLSVIVLGPGGVESPAARMAGADWIKGSLRDPEALAELVKRSDVVTAEIEHFDHIATVDSVRRYRRRMSPALSTYLNVADKFVQHDELDRLGIPVAEFLATNTADEVAEALQFFENGLVLKARRDAFDGRGQKVITEQDQIAEAIDYLRKIDPSRTLYSEQLEPIDKELSVIVAKGQNGEIVKYPLTESVHLRGQLRSTITPADVDPSVRDQVNLITNLVANDFFQGAGVMGIEMFLLEDGFVKVNEVAPRVHNTGHWTIEGSETSQFANHLRAITGMDLGSTEMRYPYVGMVNVIESFDGLSEALKLERVQYHGYGKTPRKERKLAHVTTYDDDPERFKNKMDRLNALLTR